MVKGWLEPAKLLILQQLVGPDQLAQVSSWDLSARQYLALNSDPGSNPVSIQNLRPVSLSP